MNLNRLIMLIVGLVIAVIFIVITTLAFTPEQTHPAFEAAVRFSNAAAKGDEATAFALLNSIVQDWVRTNCPGSQVSACIQGYTPPEWGGLVSAVYRRAAPDGAAWQVEIIATYEQDKGVSGVCSSLRMEADGSGAWRVAEWAGYIWCGDAASRNMATNPDTPNRVP